MFILPAAAVAQTPVLHQTDAGAVVLWKAEVGWHWARWTAEVQGVDARVATAPGQDSVHGRRNHRSPSLIVLWQLLKGY